MSVQNILRGQVAVDALYREMLPAVHLLAIFGDNSNYKTISLIQRDTMHRMLMPYCQANETCAQAVIGFKAIRGRKKGLESHLIMQLEIRFFFLNVKC